MKIIRQKHELEGIPVLEASPEVPRKGLVLLLHGLGGEKEDTLEHLERFAHEGFHVLALDAHGHGERRSAEADIEERLEGDEQAQEEAFFDVVERTAGNVSTLLDALIRRGVGCDHVAFVGSSLGAFTALDACTRDPRVDAVVSVSGSPRWPAGRSGGPLTRADAFWPTALLMLHGEQDEVVSPEGCAALFEELREPYAAAPDHLQLVTFPQEGHLMTEARQEETLGHAIAWCARHLPA